MEVGISRRTMCGGLAVAGLLAVSDGPAFAAKAKPFFERIKRPIGLQLYTLGDELASDLDAMLAKVAKAGMTDLELPQLFGKAPSELKAAGDRAGVKFSAIHLAATPNTPATALSLLSPTQRIVDDLGALGVSDAVLPIMLFPSNFKRGPGDDFRAAMARALTESGADVWKKTAALLNEKAAALKPHGIRVGYHNHNVEFAPIGKTNGWRL